MGFGAFLNAVRGQSTRKKPERRFRGFQESSPKLDFSYVTPTKDLLSKYFYGRGLVFCVLFWLLARQKQHLLAILRQKSEETKRKTKIGRAFFGRWLRQNYVTTKKSPKAGCANTQLSLCNELVPFQAILGNFQAI